jgi:dolichol-phosphate mannosyltransferase
VSNFVSIVVPFFNEAENVPSLAEQIASICKEGEFADEYECVFVNDGSVDGTRAAIDALVASEMPVVGVHFVRNFGQSAALVAGMRRARGDYIVTLDGDLQNDPCDIPKVVAMLEKYDCVCGYRAERQDSFLRKLSSRIANAVRNAVLRDGIRDSGCGTKGFRRACVKHIVSFNGVHRFFAVVLRNAGFSIGELAVTHHDRKFGTSKYGVHNRLWRGLYDLIGVTWLKRRYVAYEVEEE